MILFAAGLSFCLTLILSWRIAQPESRLHVIDEPIARSLHTAAKPRSGGLAVIASIILCSIPVVWGDPLWISHAWILLPLLAISAVSFLDDLGRVSPLARLIVHLAAAYAVGGSQLITPIASWVQADWWAAEWAGPLFATIAAAWMLNLYNFMDGMDGLAAGMTITGFSALAYIGWMESDPVYATLNLIVACAALGFLVLNYPPSRLFMGDVGACPLGLLAAISALWGLGVGHFPFWVPLIVFSPFTSDATLTLLLRTLRREKVWIGDRNHFYHKLLLRTGHRRALGVYGPVMILAALSGALLYKQPTSVGQIVIGVWSVAYVVFYLRIQLFASKTPVMEELSNPASS